MRSAIVPLRSACRDIQHLSPQEQQKSRGNLFVGLVMNEYLDDFIEAISSSQPHRRRSKIRRSRRWRLRPPRPDHPISEARRRCSTRHDNSAGRNYAIKSKDRPVYGACLCSCNGRGTVYCEHNHDARHVQEYIGPTGVGGFSAMARSGPLAIRIICTATRFSRSVREKELGTVCEGGSGRITSACRFSVEANNGKRFGP